MNLGIILNAGTCFRNENTFSLSILYRFLTSTNNFIYRTFIRVRWCGFFFYIKEVVLLHYIQHECFNWIWRLCVSKWSTFFLAHLSWAEEVCPAFIYMLYPSVFICLLSTFIFYQEPLLQLLPNIAYMYSSQESTVLQVFQIKQVYL